MLVLVGKTWVAFKEILIWMVLLILDKRKYQSRKFRHKMLKCLTRISYYWHIVPLYCSLYLLLLFFQIMNYPLRLEDVLQEFKKLYEKKCNRTLPESFISSVQRMVIKANSSGDASKK